MSTQLFLGDCLEILPTLAAGSVDAILTDLPYGTTACAWDTVIPFADLWRVVKHVLKPRGVFVTTASQPFTSALVMSNPEWFRHSWTWEKSKAANFVTCNIRPLPVTEDICVFAENGANYYPQMVPLNKPYTRSFVGNKIKNDRHETAPITSPIPDRVTYTHAYPRSLLNFSNIFPDKAHPTQKPVALYEYLVLTYTNPGETVLDLTAGSGTTGVACVKTGRNFIGIEKRQDYFEIMSRRIREAQQQTVMELT